MAGIALKYTYFKSQKDMKNLNLEKKNYFRTKVSWRANSQQKIFNIFLLFL